MVDPLDGDGGTHASGDKIVGYPTNVIGSRSRRRSSVHPEDVLGSQAGLNVDIQVPTGWICGRTIVDMESTRSLNVYITVSTPGPHRSDADETPSNANTVGTFLSIRTDVRTRTAVFMIRELVGLATVRTIQVAILIIRVAHVVANTVDARR
jgi:hypothetical protein